MAEFRFDKLVRDGIVDKIVGNGGTANSRTLSPTEMLDAARTKLLEEARELNQASQEEIPEELADIQELVNLLCEIAGITPEQLEKLRAQKAQKAGAFSDRTYIETVEVPDDSEWADYYRSQPDRYPKVK
ncbi:MAG: hypothetical protein A2782_00980 [Candidatus Blackburnbacteria bacterium RIFCSPHIGHO2_01_FULL_43_15b]|uniref:Phosphoribosyl-ATP pyrophosphohydrolase n=1 Tax=Candidatus Blackburnbacteria bacterium RIFCSPHIGHO2_01_FULL_43_15b TaxID=1797513 RepID=A0A1G1V105_9BACT|nr:MAG: hypothetical protein A2782_00980 [Candidatus Blackburnbacteria bacterium RIFCSPHIGHO2_01_FULL_43_15b]